MISFLHYIKSNFHKKKVIVNCSDLNQVSGELIKMFGDGIAILPYKKKTPVMIPIQSILLIQEDEK